MSPKKCIADAFPEALSEWDDELDPNHLTIGSKKNVRWKCSNGHEWSKPPVQRFRNNKIAKCPTCKIGAPISETHPDAILDWNDEQHDPSVMSYGSGKNVNWKCHKCNHEWKSSPNNRLKNKKIAGCPVCVRGMLHNDGRNCLEILEPEISSEWNHEKNGTLTPKDVTFGSDLSVWWKCKTCENEWQTNVYNRTGSGNNCPTCAIGRLHSDGRNSLANANPELASQWHPSKNGDLTPNDIVLNYPKYVWWYCDKYICEHPHEWEMSPNARYSSNTGCPFCAKGQASFCPCNSIANTNPELALELHPDEPISATELTAWSEKKVLWLCENSTPELEHSWKSTVHNRSAGNGCPFCAEYGFNLEEPAYFYAMEIYGPNEIWWYKGGITNDPERRRGQINNSLNNSGINLEVRLAQTIHFERGIDAKELETLLLKIDDIRVSTVETFDGNNELFSTNPVTYALENNLLERKASKQKQIEDYL
jgi:hypothetical protein